MNTEFFNIDENGVFSLWKSALLCITKRNFVPYFHRSEYFSDRFLFHLALFYPDKNILVRYGTSANFIDEYVVGCFQSGNGSVVVWSSELDLSFAEALNGTRGLGTFGEQYYKALEEATEMDVETFYQTYLDPDTETCIETPAELWLDR